MKNNQLEGQGKKISILVVLLLGMILLFSPLISSRLQFYQQQFINPIRNGTMINGTISDFIQINYDKSLDDYITSSNPLEVYLFYNIYVNQWTHDNPSSQIDYCNLTIKQSIDRSSNASLSVIYSASWTNTSFDVQGGKYFLQMQDGDFVQAYIDCKYHNPNLLFNPKINMEVPESLQLVTTTWECKACQFYEYTVQQRAINKANSISDFRQSTINHIFSLINIVFDLILALFWFAMIIILFVAISLIMMGFYWIYLYFDKVAK